VGVGLGVGVGVDVGLGLGVPLSVAVGVGVCVAVAVGVGVGVGVAGGGVPKAVPDNDTFCGVLVALSLMVRVLVSLVPLSFFALIGANVTETSQLPPPAGSIPRQSWLAL
jgi:hypothetical protein